MKQFTFYKLYSDILDGMNDTDAGKFAMRICEYEFEDKQPEEELSGKERFYWSNISDMLAEVKEAESSGKSLKKFNLRSEHFTFYETYFDAMKLLKGGDLGAFVKAICAYMFRGEVVQFKDKEIQGYYNLCKLKMDISKKRKSCGSRGGKAKCGTIKIEASAKQETDKQPVTSQYMPKITPVEEQPGSKEGMTYERFRSAYPDIQGNLYGASERYISDLNWADVAAKFEADEELGKVRNIYYLARNYKQKYVQKRQAKNKRGGGINMLKKQSRLRRLPQAASMRRDRRGTSGKPAVPYGRENAG